MASIPTQEARSELSPKQWRQFLGWAIISVVMPLVPYTLGWIIATFFEHPISVTSMLARGDLLFVVVLLLATSVDWTLSSLVETPRSQREVQTVNYVWALVSIILLVIYSGLCGLVMGNESSRHTPCAVRFEIRATAHGVCLLLSFRRNNDSRSASACE